MMKVFLRWKSFINFLRTQSNHKTFLITPVGLILLTFQNCGKPDIPDYECNSDITVFIPEAADSIFFFKEGTYWIYQREDSLYEDSVWVSGVIAKNYPVDHKAYPEVKTKKCYEFRSVTLTSKEGYFFDNTEFLVQGFEPIDGADYSKEVFFINENITFRNPDRKSPRGRVLFAGNNLAMNNGYGDIATWLVSFSHGNTTYNSVIHLKNRPYSKNQEYAAEVYYASRFGMIRFKDDNGIWWNLIRSHIVQ